MLAKARRLAARTYELTEFLTKMAKRAPGPASFDGTVTYHDSCSGLREIGVKAQPRQLLAKVADSSSSRWKSARPVAASAAPFPSSTGRSPPRWAEKKCANIEASGAQAVVLGDLGCMLNIEGRMRRRGDANTRVLHVAEVLAGSTGASAFADPVDALQGKVGGGARRRDPAGEPAQIPVHGIYCASRQGGGRVRP